MDPSSFKPQKRKAPKWLAPTVGYVLAAACLIWVFKDVDLQAVVHDFTTLDWRYVTIAVLSDLTIYLVGAWRWGLLLAPVATVSFWRAVQSIYIGLFANEVLPLRTGELIRCYLLSHWNSIPLSLSISAAALERVLEGVWLVAAFMITSMLVSLPKILIETARVLAVGLGVLLVMLAVIIWWKHHAHALASRSRWVSGIQRVVDGVNAMGNLYTMSRAAGISALYLFVQIVAVWALMKSYGLDLNFWVASAVLIILRLGTVVPNAPGNVGSTQLLVVLALRLFDVSKTDAAGFSVVLWSILTVPLLIGGTIAVALSGLNLGEIRHRARKGFEAATAARPPVG